VAGDDQAVPAAVRRAGRGRTNGHAPPCAVEAFSAQVAMPSEKARRPADPRRGAADGGATGAEWRWRDAIVASPMLDRLAALDWERISAALDQAGCATTPPLLTEEECGSLIALYPDDGRFRSRVVMERHGFGRGEYKYFGYPLPTLVDALRRALYPRLVPVANHWRRSLGQRGRLPERLDDFLSRCHAAGQRRPTPLVLRYGAGDYNCLHQDIYGDLVFPLQVTVLLSRPGVDFTGGEFLLVEQRPRAQSRGEVVPLGRGEAVIFAVHHRPVRGKRGTHRVTLRHGVSRIRSGERYSLGVILHDAA
jgi:hypothetical protein